MERWDFKDAARASSVLINMYKCLEVVMCDGCWEIRGWLCLCMNSICGERGAGLNSLVF